MIDYIKEFARFLIHPDAVGRSEEEFDFGVESSLARIHPITTPLRESAGLLLL